jgi:hypothetical protein
MNLARFPRRRYADGPSPIHKLTRLSEVLGGPDIYMKRDDLLGFAAGGNKIRKLEFVVADEADGADLGWIALVDLEHQIDPVLRELDHDFEIAPGGGEVVVTDPGKRVLKVYPLS